MSDYEWDESYDESDLESAFNDLEYDESRRRRRRRGRRDRNLRFPGRQPAPPATSGAVRREIDAGRRRDQQIARAVNDTSKDVSDIEARLNKANRDIGRLRTLSLITLLLPRNLSTQRLSVSEGGSPPVPSLSLGTDTSRPGVDVVTGAAQGPDILPLLLFLTMGKDIGVSPGGRGAGSSSNDMLPILLLALAPGLTGQPGQAGGLNTTTLALVLLASGGL